MNKPIEGLLGQLDDELVRNHRHDTELFDRLTDIQRSTGILYGGRAMCPFLRPFFLPATRYREIQGAAESLNHAFDRIAIAALEYPEIADQLSLSEKELRWARLDPGYTGTSVNSRLDTFLSKDGFAFLEFNGENPSGVGEQISLEKLFREVPEVRQFLDANEHWFPQPHKRLISTIDSVYREFGGKKAKPSIAIVDWAGVATSAEFELLREQFESQGYHAAICDPTELEYDGTVLRAGDFEIDVFYKRVIIHEFLDRFDESHPLYLAGTDGAVCMVNSFRSKIPHKKSSFSILTDPKFHRLFNDTQLDIISKHIPWTRVVRDEPADYLGEPFDLVDLIRRERHRFVLKPNDDYGGHGIFIGWESSESEWDEAINTALCSPYVVQQRVGLEKIQMPTFRNGEASLETLLVDFDPYLFRGEVEGGMVRLSDKTLINVTQGGGETALAILKDY